jgi:hypothetical protein
MKYLCVRSVKNKVGKGDHSYWAESFSAGEVYEYVGDGIMMNNDNEPHLMGRLFKFWHFSRPSRNQLLIMDIERCTTKLQFLIVDCGIAEDKFDEISKVSSEAYVKSILLRIELINPW